jgi:hypothetical protein
MTQKGRLRKYTQEKKGDTMERQKPCYCGALLGVAVIVFAWWHVAWAPYVLTAAGAIIALKELSGLCCCGTKKEGGKGCCS